MSGFLLKTNSSIVLLLTVICLLTIACYWPVLFNFFNGDDFVHLTWLAQAIHHPDLILRNFYTSWLDGTTTKFYRPLISVFMVSDYLVWGVNGLGFRLTNIAFHLASSIFIFFICRNLQSSVNSEEQSESSAGNLAWPFAASALFALYPLHPEAVSWITGRVDSVVTGFCTAAVYFYISYSRSAKVTTLAAALLASTLGLLSKEMAITLPAVFLLYEIVYGFSTGRKVFRILRNTAPFFVLLAAYFVVRRLALGTFVGGYDNSLFFISNMKEFIRGWVHALVLLFVPINKTLFSSHHLISKAFPAAIIGSYVLAALNFFLEARYRRHFLFLSGWLALCLIPVYKLFNIADDLQGSRLAYLATVPVCMLLSSMLLPNRKLDGFASFRFFKAALSAVLLALCAFILWNNNLPWKSAGQENNAIRKSLQKLYDEIPGDPEMLFLALPDQINGAYTCRNSLDGMTKAPQLSRDVRNCLMVNAFEPIFPFGYLKESIAESRDKILVYRWDSTQKQFRKVEIVPDFGSKLKLNFQGTELSEIARVAEGSSLELGTDSAGNLRIANHTNRAQYLELNLSKRSCFSCDFIEIDLQLERQAAADDCADLLYSNDMYPEFELKRRARAHFISGKSEQAAIFALRGLPEWSLGGNTGPFRLLIPAGSSYLLKGVSLLEGRKVMPVLNFPNSGYLGSKGYLHLGPKQPQAKVNYDASGIAGAKKLALELSRTNLLFEEQNTRVKSRVSDAWRILDATQGTLSLPLADFPSPGLYEMRLFALDGDGNVLGVSSDHLVISVD